ncbi:MAG TPA: SDR family NAD(P)-dependent oxidoreductase [Streptosporangiaceae bacterium]|nr:SDR family NAD(P)-dependent oxidoreductase [Streptosporangiaceae bacterium]
MTVAGAARDLLADPVDAVLEASVAGSFSRLGYEVRSRLLPEFSDDGGERRLDGRTVLITGGTSGIGLAAACALAGMGANVHLLARSAERAGRATRQIAAAARGTAGFGVADLDDLESVRSFAARFGDSHDRLDVLIHNAGAVHRSYQRTSGGLERTVAGQVVAPFVLTSLLIGLLRRSAPARVVTVSSGGMYTRPVDVAALDARPDGYRGVAAYALAKRAQVALSAQWAARTAGCGVAFHAMHPGWVRTPGIARSLPAFSRLMGPALRTPDQGADTIVWLASADHALLGSGGFWHDRRRRPVYRFPGAKPAGGADRGLWDWVAAKAESR